MHPNPVCVRLGQSISHIQGCTQENKHANNPASLAARAKELGPALYPSKTLLVIRSAEACLHQEDNACAEY